MPLNETTADLDPTVDDLGPLAWVLDELRKSLDGAIKALRRFVRDADLALGSDLAALDTSHLRIARQQLHQAEGALEMVGLSAPAAVLRAMEAVAQRFVQRPELCTKEQAAKVERASFALIEYLEAVLRSKPASPVSLFPQYRDLQEMVGAPRIHPADLWPVAWSWREVPLDFVVPAVAFDDSVRTRFDQAVLKVIKSGDAVAAHKLHLLCLGLAAAQVALPPRTFWTICAAYFEALGKGWCANDVYVKRSSSRVLTQYIAQSRADLTQIDRLAQDLLFFCSQAAAQIQGEAPTLTAVLGAYGLQAERKAVDYEARLFGRFDPAVLVQARKRIAVAKEMWAALSGGDTHKLKAAADQFVLISDSLVKLDPASHALAQALTRVMDATVRSGQAPTAPVAMEVATSVLYLEAAYDELDPEDTQLALRSERLAQRLDAASTGAEPEPLEAWMEDLYHRVSERQTMGSVVSELGITMGLLEKAMDQFFRNPQDKASLQQVPGQLAQMRGVLSLLGLDQASLAVQHMRDSVEQILVDEVDEDRARAAGTFDRMGNSLGALGFMIDMLNYQPALAKKMFVFDPDKGEFRSVMGRAPAAAVAPAPVPATEPTMPPVQGASELEPVVAEAGQTSELAVPVVAAAVAVSDEDDDAELRDIFMEEAQEVLQNGLATLDALAQEPANIALQTTLRRAFHTLKGSARMVGLAEYGEAAWALEQLLNSWIAEQQPVTEALRGVAFEALNGLQSWVHDIAKGADAAWSAEPFRAMADALRTEGRREPLQLAATTTAPVPEERDNGSGPQQPELAHDVQSAPAPQSALPAPRPVLMLDQAPAPELLESTASSEVPESEAVAWETAFVDIDFDAMPQPAPVQDAHADFDLELTQAGAELAAHMPQPLDVAPDREPEATPALPEAVEALLTVDALAPSWAELVSEETAPALEPEPTPSAESAPESETETETEPEEEVKVIGSLRIGIPLYNVYLNEADEWSRRLVTELAEWEMEFHQPVADSTVALAHSLAGSSATVGFVQLSSLARDLEHALDHVQLLGQGTAELGRTFADAAQEVRRLLHQFAAGFIKEADAQLVRALKDVLNTQVTDAPEAPDSEQAALVQPQAYAEPAWPVPQAEAAPEPEAAAVGGAQGVQASSALLTPLVSAFDAQPQEIDAQDAIDPELFPIFEEEALSLLPALAGALRQWAARPENSGARAQVLRALHTLKGSARLAGAMRLGEMAHRIESSVEALGSEALQSSQIEPLLARFDELEADFEQLRRVDEAAMSVAPALPIPSVQELGAKEAPAPASLPRLKPLAVAASLASAGTRSMSLQSVRVRPQLLDRLVNQAGEVVMTRSRLEAGLSQLGGSLGDLTGNLDRLRQQLRDIEVHAESQMQSRLALTKDSGQGFDPLEFDRFTRVQELTRMMAESVNDVATVQRSLQRAVDDTEDNLVAQARQTRELQRDLLRTRMVEFESISERLYGVVRQASKDAGKQVRLDIVGGSIEMDRSVLDRMTPAFEHLLRNCVGHGIEDPQARTQAGKDATGTITIKLNQEGNDVSVEFADDGAGLDLQGIRERALTMGLVGADQSLSDEQAANLIFTPGVSTAAQVTELAGRGIGMDVVRAEVSALGGRIETRSETGKGTRFQLILPLTTAVTQVVIVRAGKLSVGVPSNLIEMVRRVKPEPLREAYSSGLFDDGTTKIPFYWSGALLQSSARSQELDAKTLSVVIFRSAGQRVAMHVDEVLGNQEVVVKNLGVQLARLPGLAAMTVLASGAVVLIYNPVALATVYGEEARERSRLQADGAAAAHAAQVERVDVLPRTPLVLVVDDSITVRRVTQRLLLREGYRVALAVDGLQALERLKEELPAVVLSDIEMPRMDGFDLARIIRADARMHALPIVMITSRIADKHRQHAVELGVNHYLGKPYPEDELLNLVRHYCALEVSA